MLRQVDDAQLRAWQHIANHLNWKTGVSHFTAARLAIVVYAASNLTTFINKPSVLAAFPALLGVMFVPMGFWWVHDTERTTSKAGLGNPQKVFGPSYVNRMVQTFLFAATVILSVLVWRVTPGDLGILAMYAFAYLIAADMPPTKPVDETRRGLAPEGA